MCVAFGKQQHIPLLTYTCFVGQQVPAEQLSIGTLIMVKPGDGVPADGIVVSGASRIDESMLTGEPAPVSKKMDDKVRQHSGHTGVSSACCTLALIGNTSVKHDH